MALKLRGSFAALLMLGCVLPQQGVLAQASARSERAAPRTFPAVQAFADSVVREGKVPGIAIAIGVGDAAPIWIVAGKGGLTASDRPANQDTLWRIYSMTKPITAMAAMILVDEGKLRLDQPVSDFFPEFAQARVLVDRNKGLETKPATRTITIRDLMTHTSGLNYDILAQTPAQKELDRQGVSPFQVNKVMEARMRPVRAPSLGEFAKRAGVSPLVADPGTQWNYSMGLDVLAAIVEKASGTPFETFVQRRILNPLGMTSTYWQVPGAQANRFSSNYGATALLNMAWPGISTPATATLSLVDSGTDSVYFSAPSFPYGGAGLVSTAHDYERFLHMLLNNGMLGRAHVLSAATARLAMSNLMPAGVFPSGSGPFPPDEQVGFGAGGFVTIKTVDGYGRGKGTYGWDGAAGTRAWVDPVRRIRAVMMINLLGAGTMGADFDKAIAKDMAN